MSAHPAVQRGYQFRFYPTKRQQKLLLEYFGISRWAYPSAVKREFTSRALPITTIGKRKAGENSNQRDITISRDACQPSRESP